MSRFIDLHDFYRDGYTDMLAEVRVFQACGQWTDKRRASWTRRAVSEYKQVRHKYPRMDAGYWAGRLAAIKSNRTAPPKPRTETHGKMIFLSIGDEKFLCRECGDIASWKCPPDRSFHLMFYLCDRCKQEQVREQTTYSTPDGWDWDEHEDQLLPEPVPIGDKLVVSTRQGSFFFTVVAFLGFGLFEVSLHLSLGVFLLELWLLVHFMTYRKEILEGFRKLAGV